ncbi:MAG TPA: serine hydrolase domain-containing protein [Glaciihabitans sp.]|jgi:CubicO group peptidase (beta-lactamase class C family)|nr:serine hydrolase domain-containing protein [Glaciihabitans sp.]
MTTGEKALDLTRSLVTNTILPSAVLGIATSAGTVELAAFGASGSRTAHIGDRYPLFSITKPLVGLATMRAVEAGQLSLTAPLSDALPEFGTNRTDIVTLEHLLTHRSGISEPPLDTPNGLRPTLLTAGADFAAGSMTRYSTLAFEGVAAMLEDATGVPLATSIDSLASSVGATGLNFDADDTHPVFDAAELGLDYPALQKLKHPGAGLYSSADDLLSVGSSLLRGDGAVVHPLTQTAMLRPYTVGIPKLAPYTEDRGQDWGLTWNLRHAAPGLLERRVFGHGGWAGTEFWIYPDLDLCFVLLTNIANPSRLGFNSDLLHNAVVTDYAPR